MFSRRDLILTAARSLAGATVLGIDPALNLAQAQAASYSPATVTDGGSIRGRVKLNGKAPEPDRILIGKDNHVCGDGHAAHDAVQTAADGGLQRAVVALRGITSGLAWPAPRVATVTQERCAFHPYLQVVPTGTELTFHNKDPLLHNIHAYELIGRARRTLFNIAQPQAGQIDRHTLALRRGPIVEIDCDAHNWMSAWLYASEHPYAVVTDASGSFQLTQVPAGQYQLVAWHPLLGETVMPVTVIARQSTDAELQLTAN